MNPEVRSIIEKDEGRFFFGDICERYTSSKERDSKIPNIAREYIEECEKFFNRFPNRKILEYPGVQQFILIFLFFATFFSELGFNPILSPPSSEEILSIGIKALPSSFCLPVKLAVGHALNILEDSEFLFFPAIYKFHGLNDKNSFSSPYTQTLPFLTELKGKILNPVISMKMEEFVECFLEFKELLNLSEEEIESAFKRGMEAQIEFERSMRERVKDSIKNEDKLFLKIRKTLQYL
ncbi:MAG: acyl-CoA dehydratase activase-related protein [Candidatus Aminicenantia bacterium]